jgi:hypothetical protein
MADWKMLRQSSIRRSALILLVILTLCLLSACASPTVTYFPVRQAPGIFLLSVEYGKLELVDGIIRLKELGTGTSILLVWPTGYSYRVAGSKIEILDADKAVVAATNEYKELDGSPASGIEYYTGQKPPVPAAGPYFIVDKVIKNLYPWEYWPWLGLVAVVLAILTAGTIIVWLIIRRRATR